MKKIVLILAMSVVSVIAMAQNVKVLLHQEWEFTETGADDWKAGEVPGNVHMDLFNNKVIEDPFYRKNESDQQWIQDKDWIYKTTFDVSQDMLLYDVVELVFEGLDTYATVVLNGEELLHSNNMFRLWQADVKSMLKAEGNVLEVSFRSPITETLPAYRSQPYTIPVSDNDQAEEKVSVYTRKAGYHYGWDWGPRFVTCGIWKPVYLQGWNTARLSDVWLEQVSLNKKSGNINAHIKTEASSKAALGYRIKVDDKNHGEGTFTLLEGENEISIPFRIENPEWWWPNGLGEQKLYKVTVSILDDGKVIDEQEINIGLRNIEVVRLPDENGDYSFTFKVNGHEVFMKGANYIPQDNFLNRVDQSRYERTILSAKNANMNMLRIWGGGIYELDVFYDLCDEHGILVWQDFMFACAMFPGSPDFLDNIKEEAIQNVRRLRNHPSIAMWCGNNEILSAWNDWGWKKKLDDDPRAQKEIFTTYEKIFYEILPWAVAKYDGGKYYWPSSPSASYTVKSDQQSGDVHYWSVWHGKKPYEEYENNVGRFMSEYGFQAFPPFETVKTYTMEEDYDIESEIMLSHQRHPVGNPLIREYMQRDYDTPKDFESFLYASNALQADIIKYAIESHRRAMPWCMGSLYWQLNDCWPVASWAGIDYYGRWKALHYSVKNSYTEVLVSPKLSDDELQMYVVSDRLKDIHNARLFVEIFSLDGERLSSQDLAVNLKANTSDIYATWSVGELLGDAAKDDVVLRARALEGDELLSENYLLFAKPRDVKFQKAKITTLIRKTDTGMEVTCKSDNYAPKVFLSVDEGENFSDNYFNLMPGEVKEVTYDTDMSVSEFKRKLSVMSFMDAF